MTVKMLPNRRIACWMSDKKSQKMNWNEFEEVCRLNGYNVFKLDLTQSIDSQGPFSILLHKLTDIIASADQGDPTSSNIINEVETYLKKHPSVVVIDPIPNVRQLLDRYKCYSIIQSTDLHKYGVFIPNFCEITTNLLERTRRQLRAANVQYPFICKPQLGHGSKKAHQMLIIFNEENLKQCRTPCVAQSFINHNAVLYKIFIVGDKHYFVERPSLKNFYANERQDVIYFDSSDVSKAGSQSKLSVLDPEDQDVDKTCPDLEIIARIARTLRKAFGMDLLGVDIVIDNVTGRYAIIDVNAYPGYDGFPNFFEALIDCISSKLDENLAYTIPKQTEFNAVNGLKEKIDLNVFI